MGHRLEFYVNPEHADTIISIAKSFNIEGKIIGRVEKSNRKQVTLKTNQGDFVY
jgi:phosphoribosylformylglycinamidine cyclo-ligase